MIPVLVGALCCLSVVLLIAVVALAWWARSTTFALAGLIKELAEKAPTERVEVLHGLVNRALDEQSDIYKTVETLAALEDRLAKVEKRLQALSIGRALE